MSNVEFERPHAATASWDWIWNVVSEWSESGMHTLSEPVRKELSHFIECQEMLSNSVPAVRDGAPPSVPPSRILPFGDSGVLLEWQGTEDSKPGVRIEMEGLPTVVLTMVNREVSSEAFRIPSEFLAESTILGEILSGKIGESRNANRWNRRSIALLLAGIAAALFGAFVLLRSILQW